MANLSEEDRKSILGKDWKPLEPTVTDPRQTAVKIIIFAVVAVGVGGYLFADNIKQVLDHSPTTKKSVAGPAAATGPR